MEFSKQLLNELSQRTGFIKDTLEKLLRLVEILHFLNNDSTISFKLDIIMDNIKDMVNALLLF